MNVFMLTAIRSGSTYLLHLLRDTGFFHYPAVHDPHESLVPQHEIHEFFAPNPFIDPWIVGNREKTREECMSHLRHRLMYMQKQPCLFKVLMEQYNYYMLELDAEDRRMIEDAIPGLRYIWLERSDIIARTVSAYILFNSKTDHIYSQKAYDDYMQKAVHIDEKGLLDVYKNHVKRGNWSPFLHGTDYLKVEYEDLVAKPKETLIRCLDHLGLGYDGLDLQAIVDKQPKFKTERPESKEWMDKLRKILRKGMM
jgi:LPS sulfotransferase NodH